MIGTWLLVLSTAFAAEPTGVVEGILFSAAGAPITGVEVRVGGEATRTDEFGAWHLTSPVGEVVVEIGSGTRIELVPVVAGQTTEVLVTLHDGRASVTLEGPVAAPVATAIPSGPPGVLVGKVTNPASGAPLSGVRAFVRGSELSATTDEEGAFRLTMPQGKWDLSFVRPGYATESAAVEVVADGEVSVAVTLEKTGLQLSDLTITAPRIVGGTASVLDERRDASTVSDILGAEQMSKSGDSDAASALKRVTGLTVIGGKYVYVRGLGDRYSATLLNGSSLPSPEPEKRVVPLDIFPTSLVEQVIIQKTFSPDKPAEFGGGIVEVITRSVPEKPIFNIGISGAYASGGTFGKGLVGPQGETDWVGFGTDSRQLPPALAAASEEEAIKAAGRFSDGGYTPEEIESFGEMIPNRWGLSTKELPPDFGATINAGGRLRFGDFSLGGLVGGVFANGWDIDDGVRSVFASGANGLVESKRTTFTSTENTVRLGGALALGAEWKDIVKLTSTTLLNRTSVATGLRYDADDPTGLNDTRSERSSWVEQQLVFEQVGAKIDLPFMLVEGRFATALATRLEPDRREWTYNLTEDGTYVLSQRGSWSDIQFLELDDSMIDGGLDLTFPLPWPREGTSIKVGGLRATRARTSGTRRFGYQFNGTEGLDLGGKIEDLMVAENIGQESDDDLGYLQLEENTINSDDYTAGQEIYSAYAMGDAVLTGRFRALGGLRFERSVQTVTTFEQFDTEKEPVIADLGASDFLPAATLTYAIGPKKNTDQMLVRAGYGRTLSRPEFRELTEVQYYDYRTGRTLYGNPELRRAIIENVDARWEWYPRDGESVSVGAFFKYFDQPIESVVAVSAVSGSVGTFANATSATNVGTEIDFRQSLDRFHPALADFYFSGNVAIIASEVDLSGTDGNQTSEQRPLQGQSPWVVNAQISYENPDIRTSVSLLYNAFGPRIVDVGTSGIPDTYEMPVHRLDAVWTQGLGKHFQTRVKLANVLDWPSVQMIGDNVSEETRDGWSAGLALTWTP